MEQHLLMISPVRNAKNVLQAKGFWPNILNTMCDIMKNYQCEHCRKKYKQKQSLDKHMLLHFPRKKCNLCNLVLSRDKVLIQKHMNMHLQKIKVKKQDPLKGKQFYSREPGNILPKSGHINPAPLD